MCRFAVRKLVDDEMFENYNLVNKIIRKILFYMGKFFDKKVNKDWVAIFLGSLMLIPFLVIHCGCLGRCGSLSKDGEGVVTGILYLYSFLCGGLAIILWDLFKCYVREVFCYKREKFDLFGLVSIVIGIPIYIYALNNMSFVGVQLISFIVGSIFITELSQILRYIVNLHNRKIIVRREDKV